MSESRIPAVRLTPENDQILKDLGLLAGLAGTWQGHGFNLIARPDKEGNAPLFLELNQTREVLKIDPIGSPIPNRGFAQDDIQLAGLTYLQKISDSVTGGALHIEPGIWITQPDTTAPPQSVPTGQQIIGRMATIPHGNSLLAAGVAQSFSGTPVLASGTQPYAFSVFPSFNSSPFVIQTPGAPPPGAPPAIKPPGSQPFGPAIPGGGFKEYDLSTPESATNPRTPFGNVPPIPLPADIDGVPMQKIIGDPIALLQAVIQQQVNDGHAFSGVVLNIATQATIAFANDATPPIITQVPIDQGSGGIENIPFLQENATTALVYATFWIEEVTHPQRRPFTQLQYAQMVLLNFPALGIPGPLGPGGPPLNFSWPHISVATLKRTFG